MDQTCALAHVCTCRAIHLYTYQNKQGDVHVESWADNRHAVLDIMIWSQTVGVSTRNGINATTSIGECSRTDCNLCGDVLNRGFEWRTCAIRCGMLNMFAKAAVATGGVIACFERPSFPRRYDLRCCQIPDFPSALVHSRGHCWCAAFHCLWQPRRQF